MILLLIKRFFGRSKPQREDNGTSAEQPEAIVERIQQGDAELRETFISAYRPYIAKVTSRFSKRFIDSARDDEFSIALLAFDEAITHYSSTGGSSFLGFAETVIRRRLIDYVRKEQRHKQSVPLSAFDLEDEEESSYNTVETTEAVAIYEQQLESERRRYEIVAFQEVLTSYGIAFSELADKSPKHKDSREALYEIGSTLARDERMMTLLEMKRQLPIKELLEVCTVSRKTLERNRKFIIAAALIMAGDYPHLQSYIGAPILDQTEADKEVGT